jgi:LysM repeat protein
MRRMCRIGLLVLLVASVAFGRDVPYVVKAHDTLYDIARQNGISVRALAERNRLGSQSLIYVGQHLWIPGATAAAAKPETTALPASISQAIARAPVKSRRWKYIVIHHSGVNEGTLKGIDRYHREQRHMEHGLAYHFLIGNGNGMGDGEIAVGNRWKKQQDGGHLHSAAQNQVALGICLIGNFDQTKPTKKQLASLEALIRSLMKRCHLSASAVKTHQQINVVGTRCPGTKFPARSFIAKLK